MHRDDERLWMKEREREREEERLLFFFLSMLPKFVFRSVLRFPCAQGGGYMVTVMMQ